MLHPGYLRKILRGSVGEGVLGTSWCCGNHCRWFYSLSFQSFEIARVRMIPTYPSPKSTLVLTSHLGQNVSLGEG